MKSSLFTSSSFNVCDETSFYDNNITHAFRQFAFFQFSSSSVINTFHNIFIECWTFVIKETTIPLLMQYLNLTESQLNRSLDSIRDHLNGRLAQHGKLELILTKAKKYADKWIFNVPRNISFEEKTEIPNDESDVWKRIEELEERVIMLRLEIQNVKNKKKNAEFHVEFLKTFH